jgi:hypothetical protein
VAIFDDQYNSGERRSCPASRIHLEGTKMALRNPKAVFNAASNLEARLICNLLNDAEIEAYTTEDVSPVGVCVFGLISEIHKPQVWTDQADIDRAIPVLQDYERQHSERQRADVKSADRSQSTVVATCEECGRSSVFPAEQKGTVQDCPHCGRYMDVEEFSSDPDADFSAES